jgi:hypothetical protein
LFNYKNWWVVKNYNRVIDLLIPIVAIFFTLLVEGKFDGYQTVKEHPVNFIVLFSVISIVLVILKLFYESNQENLEKSLESALEENLFLKDLISSFKYQISQPLEDKLYEIYKDLKFDNHYRITVYTYTKDRFFSIGRYSNNTHYKAFGRIAIKDKSEVLFKAWYNGELNEKVSPQSSRKMPSERIAIKYLYEKNDNTPDKDKFGVVVFETTQKNTKKLNNGNLDLAVKKINEFLNDKMGIKQDLKFAMEESV